MTIKQFLALAGFLSLLVCAQSQTDPAAKPKKLRVSSGVAEGLKTHDVTLNIQGKPETREFRAT